MDFDLNEEQILCQNMAEEFARIKLAPHAAHWDETSFFPIDILKEAASLGMAGMFAREDIGGSALSRLSAAIIFEALAQGCISTSAYLSIHNMVIGVIDRWGSESLRKTWGPKLTSMALLASYCLTEPGAGSDAASLKTKAVLDGDTYILNGSKSFISGATVSDVYLCMARTGDESSHGISCFLVPKDTPGLSFGHLEKKMGWKSQPTAMVFFENCRIPANYLVGELGSGFKIALSALNGGRINIAACSLGGAKACLVETKRYMSERKQFGLALKDMQALRFIYADMVSDYEAARLLVHRAAHALEKQDAKAAYYCALAKKRATDTAFDIANRAMQLHGGYGYLQDYPIERIFRDLRVHQILEGTNQIMQEIIAKTALSES